MGNVVSLRDELSNFDRHEIQVSGLQLFPADKWRDAITYYLDGVWANEEHVMYRPKIFFGGLTLRQGDTEYIVRGTGPDAVTPVFKADEVLSIGCGLAEVDQGLMCFVRNETIKALVIDFSDGARMYLWKEREGQYGCAGLLVSSDYQV